MKRCHLAQNRFGLRPAAAAGLMLVFALVSGAAAQNVVKNSGFDGDTDWTVSDMGSTDPSVVEFDYTADAPAAGSGGCLHVYGSSTYTNVLVWQALTLKGGMTYELSGAFKDLGGDNDGGFWSQLYLSMEPPVDGVDWKPPAGANKDYNLGFNSWSGCSGAGVNGTYEDGGCDGKNTPYYTVPGNPGEDVTVYLGIKTGVWSGTDPLSYDVLIDDVTLSPIGHLHNYVVDPGFEDGTAFTAEGAPGWNGWIDEAFLDSYYPRSGLYDGGLIADPSDWATGYGQWVTGLIPGTEYVMTAFGRLAEYNPDDPNEWGLYMGIQNFGRAKVQTQLYDPDYKPVILTFVMGDTNTMADVWAWKGPGGEATTDDWGVWDMHNFLKNGDFEKGSLYGWNAMTDPASADSIDKAGGKWCGALPEGKAGFGQVARHLMPNTTYGLKVSAKVSDADGVAFVTLKEYGGEAVTFRVRKTDYADTTMAFTTGATDTSAMVMFSKNQGGKAFADNFLLCQMMEPAGGTAVRDRNAADLPKTFDLEQNYPNPFNPDTKIAYRMPVAACVDIAVYDLRGRMIKSLADGVQTAGSHEILWNGTDRSGGSVPTGIYVLKMRVSSDRRGYTATRKMVLMK
jgi:hypothetical protein